MWKINSYTDDEMLDYCGMDALCFLRILSMGYRICGIGVLNAVVLMPLYSTASSTITSDRIKKVSMSNVEVGSYRLVVSVLCAYLLFGYVMYLILEVSLLLEVFRFFLLLILLVVH
jgi:Late exocytosis, associated with Golgi transport